MSIDPNARDRIREKAEEVGRWIAQTPEYAYLSAAHREIGEDREATELMNRLRGLQEKLLSHMDRGEEPPAELKTEIMELTSKLQESSRYQAMISAQVNFDKLMDRVNQAIGRGIKAGEKSRIILPT